MENHDRELWEVTEQKASLLVNAAVQGATPSDENFLDGTKPKSDENQPSNITVLPVIKLFRKLNI